MASEMIKKDKVKEAASEWLQRYKKVPSLATAELVNLVICASGSQKKVDEATFESADLTELMQTFHTDNYLKSGGDYPLKPSSRPGALNRDNFCQFWAQLVTACKVPTILDEYLMPSLNAWLVMFSRYAGIFLAFVFQSVASLFLLASCN